MVWNEVKHGMRWSEVIWKKGKSAKLQLNTESFGSLSQKTMQPIQAQKEDVKTNMKIMKGNSTFLILLARYDCIILRRQKKIII